MTERKKKLLSLFVSTSILIGATGCSKVNVIRNIDSNNVATYEGIINIDGLDNLYIVEIKDLNENKEIYLTNRGIEKFTGGHKYKFLGTNLILAESDNMAEYTSDFGEVINVLPFKQFFGTYYNKEITNHYFAQEIVDIFNCIKKDYNELLKNPKVKKLELK